jgi:hypothetical protein
MKILHALNRVNPEAYLTRSPLKLLKFTLKTIDDDISSYDH